MATAHTPRFDSAKASKRFIRNMVWVGIICALFLAGQGLRYHFSRAQLAKIHGETTKLYTSVLGEDIGGSPFGRLQFEHGKLSASLRIGLDPLSVLAALSRPADENLRLEGMTIEGMRAKAHGFYGPNTEGFERYLEQLSDDDHYLFSLNKREDVFGGVSFSLNVEPQ